MLPFQTQLWWSSLVSRRESLQQGALANARAAVERDRAAAAQRAEVQAALERLAAEARRAAERRARATRAS